VENPPVWTEEPSSIEVSPPLAPAFNAVQALALGQPTSGASETLKPENSLRNAPMTNAGSEENGEVHGALHKESVSTAGKEPQVYPAQPNSNVPLILKHHKPYPHNRSPLRTGTDPAPLSRAARTKTHIVRSQPLRTTSTHSHGDVPHRAFESPLLASLFTGSCGPPTLFVLAIAVAYNGLQDPQHDFGLIQEWLKDHESRSVRFLGISGEEARRERIEDAIGQLYREALRIPGSKLLILLTGEGDYTNRMYLMGGRFVTDSDLRNWLWKLRHESKPAGVPATIVLDYCRMNKHIPLGATQEGVEFVWSCSLGQTAAALRLSSAEDIPRSCFLLALMMSSYNYASVRIDLSAAINHELNQLSNFLDFTSKKVHKQDQCAACLDKAPCGMLMPHPQAPDWKQAGCMQPVYDLAHVLSTITIVPKIYRVLMNNRWFREANQLPINWVTTAKWNSSDPSRMVRYKRGTCQPVHALTDQELK
ncbi:hypothetical protein FRC11_009708, partial [Ceratobasidium sp. 423]